LTAKKEKEKEGEEEEEEKRMFVQLLTANSEREKKKRSQEMNAHLKRFLEILLLLPLVRLLLFFFFPFVSPTYDRYEDSRNEERNIVQTRASPSLSPANERCQRRTGNKKRELVQREAKKEI
jgi:hypothetical protein